MARPREPGGTGASRTQRDQSVAVRWMGVGVVGKERKLKDGRAIGRESGLYTPQKQLLGYARALPHAGAAAS